jgi:pre-mRNA-processing factor 6
MGDLARGQSELSSAHVQQEQDRGDYSESNYDEFSGYGEKLFAAGAYDEDDADADRVYDTVDEMMDSRRKRSREQQLALEKKRAKSERPRIADQFADLKRELSTVSAEQWDAIPEVGDHSLKLKQSRKRETFMPVPDSLIEAAQRATTGGAALVQSLDPASAEASGMLTALGGASSVSAGRGSALSSRLDKMADSVSGQTVVDPKGYLTSLNSIKVTSEAEVGDIKKARLLLLSVITTNPKHGPGWIAAARVEEFAGKMPAARKLILQGCETCPESEDVWLEAARLHPPDTAKTILANAVLQLPTSVKIWLKAAELETQEQRKKAVLRRSLEFAPTAVNLWKAAIELENVTDARIMLARAVECVPHSVEMWLALAKLETHENARKVLNQARQAVPRERATWITAAKLEEANGNAHLVPRIIEKMVVSLAQYQVSLCLLF